MNNYFEKHAQIPHITLIGPEKFPATGHEADGEPVIFVDGGVKHRRKNVGISVGDGDSAHVAGFTVDQLDVLLPQAKDYSDFAFVLRSLPQHIAEVRTFGFLGGRTDHQLINFGEAHHFLKVRDKAILTFDHEAWGLSAGLWRPRITGLFSIINFEACDLRIEGLCDFQIKTSTRMAPVTSRGLSNVGHGQIEIEASAPIFILPERRLHLELE